jgi:hypothetical protein
MAMIVAWTGKPRQSKERSLHHDGQNIVGGVTSRRNDRSGKMDAIDGPHIFEAREIPGADHIRRETTIVDAGANRKIQKGKGDDGMNWGPIPDRSIINVLKGIREGRINPKMKTYVFKLADRHLGVDAETEADARDYCDYKGYEIIDLVDVDPMTINGMTIEEIELEAKKRNLEGEIVK